MTYINFFVTLNLPFGCRLIQKYIICSKSRLCIDIVSAETLYALYCAAVLRLYKTDNIVLCEPGSSTLWAPAAPHPRSTKITICTVYQELCHTAHKLYMRFTCFQWTWWNDYFHRIIFRPYRISISIFYIINVVML